MTARLLIVEDHPLVATSLQIALEARGWTIDWASGPSLGDIVAAARRDRPACALVDLHLGDVGAGLDLIAPLREAGCVVVMLTAETDPFALAACVEAGAEGWISKGAFLDDVVAAVEGVLAGRPLLGSAVRESLLAELRQHRESLRNVRLSFDRLSQRERIVLSALVDGLSAEEIAACHFVSIATVRSQIRSILQKLQVHSQLAAVALANRSGWYPPAAHAALDAPLTIQAQAGAVAFHQSWGCRERAHTSC